MAGGAAALKRMFPGGSSPDDNKQQNSSWMQAPPTPLPNSTLNEFNKATKEDAIAKKASKKADDLSSNNPAASFSIYNKMFGGQ